MNSFASASVVVVAGCDSGRFLAQSLHRMGLSGVRIVPRLEEAQRLCESNRVDGCLVVLPRAVPDELPPWNANTDAPGRSVGVPSLLVADVITPYVAKAARNSGYFTAIETRLPPRLLYRCIRALLQRGRRQAGTAATLFGAEAAPVEAVPAHAPDAWTGGKVKLQ
jgi:hypothetical protein